MLSATIDRMTQRSSTQVATLGNNSLTAIPELPCFLNLNGDFSKFPVLVRTRLGISNGNGLPLSRSSIGLGSNRSTWDGPPDMKRKMMRLAVAGNWRGCTVSGSDEQAPPAATSA